MLVERGLENELPGDSALELIHPCVRADVLGDGRDALLREHAGNDRLDSSPGSVPRLSHGDTVAERDSVPEPDGLAAGPDEALDGAAAQSINLGPIVNPANGHTYYRLTSSSWTAAANFAHGLGGYLVTINDAAENEWVRATFAATTPTSPGRVWIGLSDAATEGHFVWDDGSSMGFSNWDIGEPNNNGNEDYVLMYSNGPWNDAVDLASPVGIGPVYGVVEVVPSPFAISWWTLDGGGGTVSAGALTFAGTIGQPDASPPATGAPYTETGGFWPAAGICPGDFNGDGATQVQDIFDFLAAWFAGNAAADFDRAGGITVQDIFGFLAAWFAGC